MGGKNNQISDDKVKNDTLLNTLLYFGQLNVSEGITLKEAIENTENQKDFEWETPAGMTSGKPEAVRETIKNDPKLGNLKIVGYTLGEDLPEFAQDLADGKELGIKDGGPVILALEDTENHEVTFVFRGTNTLEWLDNAEGFANESSRLQEQALAFFEKTIEENGYNNGNWKINVTGHSKGGNKAQYITIKSKYKVDECVSIDGQGFSTDFINKNQQLIDARADKITNVCADKDYVNVLGEQIAGNEIVYESYQDVLGHKSGSKDETKYTIGSKIPGVNNLMSHDPSAIIHLDDNGDVQMNDRGKRSSLSEKIAEFSHYVMQNCSKTDQSKVFFSAMSILEADKISSNENCAGKDPIIGNTQMYSKKQINEGLEIAAKEFANMEKANLRSDIKDVTDNVKDKLSNLIQKGKDVIDRYKPSLQLKDKVNKFFSAVTYPTKSAIEMGKKLLGDTKDLNQEIIDSTKELNQEIIDSTKELNQEILDTTNDLGHSVKATRASQVADKVQNGREIGQKRMSLSERVEKSRQYKEEKKTDNQIKGTKDKSTDLGL